LIEGFEQTHTLALALVVCSRLSIVPDRADCATSSGDFLETAEEDMIVKGLEIESLEKFAVESRSFSILDVVTIWNIN
jgi:hypothetical protein